MELEGETRQVSEAQSLDDQCIALISGLFRAFELSRTQNGWLAPIDWGLDREAELDESSIQARASTLSPTRVETFVTEISAALGSLNQMGQRYNDLRRQVTALTIERIEQEGEQSIREQEVADGYLDIESRVADADAAGQAKWAAATADSAQTIETMQSDPFFEEITQNDPRYVAHIRASISTAGLYSAYKTVHDRETPDKANLDNNTVWISDPFNIAPGSRPPDVVPDRGTQTGFVRYRAAHYKATYAVVGLESYAQKTQLVSQSALSKGLAGSADDTLKARQVWADWKKLEVSHRRSRLDLFRLLNAVRRDASDEAGAPMEFGREMSALRTDFTTTLASCLAKADVASVALSRMFSISALRARPSIATWDDRAGSYLAAIAEWYAELRAELDSTVGRDGSELVSVSLAAVIGRRDYDAIAAAARAASATVLAYKFQIPSNYFVGLDAIRIAGLTGYAKASVSGETGPWRVRVAPPERTCNMAGGIQTSSYDQPRRWTDLGRVAGRRAIRTPDINGLAALRNLQPLSGDVAGMKEACWLLEVERYSISGEDACDLTDIELDLILNVRRD